MVLRHDRSKKVFSHTPTHTTRHGFRHGLMEGGARHGTCGLEAWIPIWFKYSIFCACRDPFFLVFGGRAPPRDEKIWSLQAQKNLMKKMGPVFYIKVCPEWVTGKRQGGSKRKLSGVLGTRLPRYCWTTDERVAVRVPKTSLWEQKGPRRGFHPIEKPEVQKWVLNFWLPMQCDLAPHI